MGNRSIISLFKEQISTVPSLEKFDATDKVVLVVGANTGIGWEAAKHFATMNPARLLLGCRSKERGTVAIESAYLSISACVMLLMVLQG